MMTLDEAIQHTKEVAERLQKEADKQKGLNHGYYKWRSEHAETFRQRARWLEELKDYRRFNGAKTFDNGFKQGEKYGYKKAIDDFADKISTYGTYDDYGNVIDVLEIAEELKKEREE